MDFKPIQESSKFYVFSEYADINVYVYILNFALNASFSDFPESCDFPEFDQVLENNPAIFRFFQNPSSLPGNNRGATHTKGKVRVRKVPKVTSDQDSGLGGAENRCTASHFFLANSPGRDHIVKTSLVF